MFHSWFFWKFQFNDKKYRINIFAKIVDLVKLFKFAKDNNQPISVGINKSNKKTSNEVNSRNESTWSIPKFLICINFCDEICSVSEFCAIPPKSFGIIVYINNIFQSLNKPIER